VDASDLSEAALGRAREGVYTRNSFRGTDLAFRDRHFSAAKKSFILDPRIRGCVSFFPGNLVSGDFPTRTVYDVIFCRNLLIYFDRLTQKKALDQISRLLVSGGLLFVGPAEQPLIAEHGFTPLGIAMAFASRKTGPASACLERIATVATRSPFASARPTTQFSQPGALRSNEPAEAAPARTPAKDLETVRMFADAGNLREAASLCEAYLRMNTASAEGWYLLGLIREATQDPGAVECYRKALYLDPDHYETLLQMSSLAEKDGNETVARMFRGRASRSKIRASGLR
jgi:chemotaxis protein methyltransferase WspC